MSRPVRILAVTLGLLVAGAVFGAIAGAAALAISELLAETRDYDYFGLEFAAVTGALIGGIATPPVAWLFLRRVPLGRLFVGSVGGAVLGGVIGWTAPVAGDQIENGVLGAFIGFIITAAMMRSDALAGLGSRG